MNKKGFSLTGFIIALAVVLVAVGVIYFLGFGGFGKGGGEGDGEGEGRETVLSSESINQTENSTEITEPETEELKIIELTVSGNDYIYNNKKYSLDDIIKEIEGIEIEAPIKIIDDKSSLKAYKDLREVLDEKNIHYIEAN